MTHSPAFAAFVVAVALATGAAAADAGWWDDAGAARRATLTELRKDPDRWRDVTVVIDVKLARVVDPGNPYFTRFTSREWRAVGAFAPDAAPSDETTPEQPFERIFVRRGSDCERRLDATPSGRRIQLRAAVRDAVKGEPWIETLDVVVDGDPLTPEEATAAERAEELLARGNAAGAEPIFRALLAKRTLPKAVQVELWRKIAAASWAQRRLSESVDAYAAALALDPTDVATAERLATAKSVLASMPTTIASIGAASVAPGSMLPPAPTRRLLPPTGMTDDPRNSAAVPAPRPTLTGPNAGGDAPPRPAAPVAAPASPAPPVESESPPAPPKRQLAGPK